MEKLRALPPVIGKRVLHTLTQYVCGAHAEFRYKLLAMIYDEIQKDLFKPQRMGQGIIFPSRRHKGHLIIGRVLPDRQELVPISVGETMRWDGRWTITLNPLKDINKTRALGREQLYIRHMNKSDAGVPRRGVRIIRASPLPEPLIRGGLPMISTKDGYVVLAPQFKVADRSYGVDCQIRFDPLLPLTLDPYTNVS